MAKKGVKKAVKSPSLAERITRIEQRQREFELEIAGHDDYFNQFVDRHDKELRTYRQQVHEIVGMIRIMAEKQIEIYELQEKAELRQDKHEERLADFEKSMGKLAKEQAEVAHKLNALLDYEKRTRRNGHTGKGGKKKQ